MSFSTTPIRSNADKVDASWWNSLRAAGVLLESVGGGICFQEALGTGDGVSTSFGPLSFTPTTTGSIAVFLDRGIVPNSLWSLSGADILFSTPPAAGQSVYVYYQTSGTATPIAPSGAYNVLYRTITSGEAAAKQLTLPATPLSASKVTLDIIGIGAQVYSSDFTVSGTTLSWTGLGMDLYPIASGDVFRIVYLS